MEKFNSLFGPDTMFARFMNKLWDIIWTGLLWVLCSLPVVTMGASSCAAYQCIITVARGKNSGVTNLFFQVFKENIKTTIVLKIIGILFIAWLGFDIIYLYGYGTDFSRTLSFILYIVLALYIMVVSYLYPLTSRFDESRFTLFKLSFYLTFRYFLMSIATLIIFLVCVYAVYAMPWTIFLMPGFYWYLVSFPVKKAIGMMAGDKDTDEEEEEFIPKRDTKKKEEKKQNKEEDTEEERKQSRKRKDPDDLDDIRKATPEEIMGPKTVKVKKRKIKNPWKKKDVGPGRVDAYRDETGEYDQDIYGRAPVEIETKKDEGPVDKVIDKG